MPRWGVEGVGSCPRLQGRRGDCPAGDGIRSVPRVRALPWASHHGEEVEASPRVVPGGWIGQGWAGSGPITGVKQASGQVLSPCICCDFPTDICQDSQHCLTPGACVQAHLYNSHVGFSPGDPEVLQVWHRGRGGSCGRQLRGDTIALGSPIAKVTSQLGDLLTDLGQVTYL